ncbi:hypothetical protein BU26DRAFT_437302 [Trematosphaeria pertusa]|uniref:Serine-rich protein n=1 Tax=Trematosphaeria pertusa TaxID=390896 RepID=A0A6A6HZ18_9PLEO|nr:uncharacterized protein BU26DRAFT_437302 [Trematosphaeria pertusa]KAF2243311.1 hypothetical protein BU26DRAFT_437302 [Trematosphaeria pertusa]
MSSPDRRTPASSASPSSSPLARAPKFSPPTTRNVSPRRPLHDRSNSETNQYSGPTIRIVEDPGTDVYSKTPFPSQPSQILPPRNAPGYAFERRGSRVSDQSVVANAVAKIESSKTLDPKPLQHKKAIRHSTSTRASDADTLVASSFSPSSSRFSQGSTPPSSPPPDFFTKERGLDVLEEVPSPPQKSTIRAVTPSISSGADDPLEGHALTPRASAASLASTASAESSPTYEAEHKRHSSSVSQPSGKGHKYTPSSGSHKKKQASSTNTAPRRLIAKESTESFAYSDTSYYSERPRSSSHPSPTLHEARTATFASGVRVHYPVVRAPSASSLWAESQDLPTISSRMNNRASQVHQWSSQLSTIPSESERGSRSIGRASHSFSARSHSQDDNGIPGPAFIPRRRQTVGSVSSSDNVSSEMTESSVAMPLPLFSPITRPSGDERDSDERERHDTITPLQSPPLRMKRSFLRRHDSDSRSTTSSRPSSSQSDLSTFIANTIPAWARVYYRRGERTSLGAPESSTESSESIRVPTAHSGRTNTPSESNFPLSIYRPRNRPHQRISQPDTVSISDGPFEQEIYVIGPARRPLAEPFTPHLRPDRRSQARLSAWKAPSFDDSLGSMLFSRQNRQILLFCLGFIFPLAWMIASFLPLPPDPDLVQEPTPSQMDLERQLAQELGPVEDKTFRKAMWWRNLNRIMSGIGTLLIGVIIALAVLASKMS